MCLVLKRHYRSKTQVLSIYVYVYVYVLTAIKEGGSGTRQELGGLNYVNKVLMYEVLKKQLNLKKIVDFYLRLCQQVLLKVTVQVWS